MRPLHGVQAGGRQEEFDVDDVSLHLAGRAERMEIQWPYRCRLQLEYDDNRAGLLQLYSKGKQQQWDAAERIDWSQDLDPENPMLLDDRVVAIYGSDIWSRMTDKEHRQVRHHQQAWQISQFMHGEQGR
jgi:hypothetical protein